MNRLETIDANLAKCIMKAKEPQINLIVERVCEWVLSVRATGQL